MASLSTLRIAWRNLGRNRKRTAFALTAIAVGQFAFLATAALMHGYGDEFMDSVTGPMVGHVQVHAPGWRNDRSVDLVLEDVARSVASIQRTPGVKSAAARIYAPVLAALDHEGFMSMVVGIDPRGEAHEKGLLPQAPSLDQFGNRQVLIGHGFARRHGIEPGMEIAVVGQDVDGSIANDLFTVASVVRSPVDVVNNLGIVMSLGDAEELLQLSDQAHEIIVHVNDPDMVDVVASRIAALPALTEAEVLPWQEIVPQFVSMIKLVDWYALIILFIVCIAALAGIANTMLMSTFERMHEFGMLLSLGCSPGRLSRIVTIEAILLGLLGVGIGSALGIGFVALTYESGIDYAALGGDQATYEVAYQGLQLSSKVTPTLHSSDIIAAVSAVLLTSLISVIWPTLRIIRLEPMEAIRS